MDTKTLLIEIGKRIASRRKDLNMTQEALADKMDVSIQTISYIETGKKGIRPENLIRLCHALSISADYILTGSTAFPPYDEFSQQLSMLSEPQKKNIRTILSSCMNLMNSNDN